MTGEGETSPIPKILPGLLTAVVFEIIFSVQTFTQIKYNLFSVFFACRQMEVKMKKINVMDTDIKTMVVNGVDYVSITDIARRKNPVEPKDVVKNWMRTKNTIEYLGLWEMLNNPNFKGVEFDPFLKEAGSHAFTMSPSRWIEQTGAIGLVGASRALKNQLPHPYRCHQAELDSRGTHETANKHCLCKRS